MQSVRFTFGLIAILGFAYLAQSHPLSSRETVKSTESTEVALPESTENVETKEVALPDAAQTTAIDTLGESNGRVKRQGGCGCCGCGCGCCCCRPRCCCCCRRCCTCCRTCCCTRCCTCCRPCCCGCGGGCGCGCGCGCCGCGGGGRKRRSLQTLKIKLAEKVQRETRQIEQVPETVAPVETVEIPAPETVEENKPEEVETATEWPEPVYELVTETWAH